MPTTKTQSQETDNAAKSIHGTRGGVGYGMD